MENNKVKYARGLRANYDAIDAKDPNKVYFCMDTGEIFLGETPMSSIDQINKAKDRLSAIEGNIGNMEELEVDADSLVAAINRALKASGGDYSSIANKPSINDVELVGNKTFEELGATTITNEELKTIIDAQYELIFG